MDADVANRTLAFIRGAFLLGFAFGGFFDGILLHQILQWHHLLSAVEGAPFDRLEAQVLADGLFHALMYVLAALGLWQLWRGARMPASRTARLVGWLLVGFGAWHLVDAIVFHWLLGIHHIRMDGPVFMLDLAFFLLGVACVGLGWVALTRAPPGGGIERGGLVGLTALAFAAGTLAALPPAGEQTLRVAFPQGVGTGEAYVMLAAAGGTPVGGGGAGEPWLVRVPDGNVVAVLRQAGATVSAASPFTFGCFGGWGT